MGKDNSIPEKSTLRCQVDALNETLKTTFSGFVELNISNNLQNVTRLLVQKEKQLKDMHYIIDEFAKSIVTVKDNSILTEKNFYFKLDDIIDLSEKSSYVQQIKSKENTVEQDSIKEEIATLITSQMEAYVKNTLEELNKYTNLQFYLKSYKQFRVYGVYELTGKLFVDNSFKCIIDIY